LLPRKAVRPLITNAHHKAGQVIIIGVALEVRRGLRSPRRSAPQVVAEVVEANNNGGWAAIGRWQSQITRHHRRDHHDDECPTSGR
jgi:hypothetical protein